MGRRDRVKIDSHTGVYVPLRTRGSGGVRSGTANVQILGILRRLRNRFVAVVSGGLESASTQRATEEDAHVFADWCELHGLPAIADDVYEVLLNHAEWTDDFAPVRHNFEARIYYADLSV